MLGTTRPRVPAHQVTTRNLGAAYPFIAEAGLGQRGVVIGDDLLGGSFVFDPFEVYAQGVVSNPNMVVFGQIGRGKSAFVKTFLWRQAVFGRRAWVVDPKGEYGDLAAAWGVRPVALRPGGAIQLNPLDPGPEHEGGVTDGVGSTARRQIELLTSLASACLGRSLLPRERAALGIALVAATERSEVPTVPLVVEALLTPTANSAASLRTELRDLLEDGRVRHVRRADVGGSRPLCPTRRARSFRALPIDRIGCADGLCHRMAAGTLGSNGVLWGWWHADHRGH